MKGVFIMINFFKNRILKVYEACNRKTFLVLSLGLFFCSAVITLIAMFLPYMAYSAISGPANLFEINWLRADIIFLCNIFILYFLSCLKIKGVVAASLISTFVFLKEVNDAVDSYSIFLDSYGFGIGFSFIRTATILSFLALILFIVSYFALKQRFEIYRSEELRSTSLKSLFESLIVKISSLENNYKYSFIGGMLILISIFLPIKHTPFKSTMAYMFIGESSTGSLVMGFFVIVLLKSILDNKKSLYYLFSSLTAFTFLFWTIFKELFVKSKIGIGFIFYLVGILLVALFAVKEYRQDTSVK